MFLTGDADSESRMHSGAVKAGAVILTAAAVFGTLVAVLTYRVFCVHYEGAEACLGRRTEFVWHAVLALAGLAAAVGMVVAAFRGSRSAALILLAPGLALYAISFLLSDAAIHGWDDLQVFPSR